MVYMDEQSLGRHLQSARVAAGLTQQELCQRAGISYSTLAKIERGAIKAPSVFTIQRLCEVLGTSLDQLMGNVGPALPQRQKGRSKSGVTFVYFDINGCLVRFFHHAFTELANDTGMPADQVETIFWHYNDAVCRGEMPLDDFNRILAEQLHHMIDWKAYYMRAVTAISEMHEVVKWAAENYKVGLLSNIMPGFIPEMVANGLLPDVPYDAIIDSSEVASIKPEPRIYELAEEKAGVPADEILFIDDSRSNIMPASQRGWKVLWFDDFRPEESVARVRQALEPENGAPVQAAPNRPVAPAEPVVPPVVAEPSAGEAYL